MEPIITVDGLQFNPPTTSGSGFDCYDDNGFALKGWYGAPAKKLAASALPYSAGSYLSSAYDAQRDIEVSGLIIAPDRPTLLTYQQQLAGICADPDTFYQFQVVDDLGTRYAMVKRKDPILIQETSDITAKYSLSLTAADPRRLDITTRTASTLLAQSSGVSGVAFRGALGSNLLSNPTMETNVTNWTAFNTTLTQSTTQAHGGTHSAKIVPNGTSSNGGIESEKHAVSEGQAVQVSAWVWFTTGVTTNFSLTVNWYNGTTFLSQTNNKVSVVGTTWTQVTNTFQAPIGATNATIVPTLFGTPLATQIWYFDDASLSVGSNTAFKGPGSPSHVTGLGFGTRGSTGIINLDNTAGTADSDILFTITGPLSNPSVSTSTSWITYLGALGTGDVLTIDTGSGQVLFNGSNRRSLLTRADFFRVPKKQSLYVRFSADVPSSTASCTATWRNSYL